jgi:UDP-N-acetylmuramoylalanine--D-glutamate ligase
MELKNKKVLLVGLGQLGGGIAAATFLVGEGAILTVTDAKSEKDLARSVRQLSGLPIVFHLGKHDEKDFLRSDIIVFNPAVSVLSPWARFVQKHHLAFYNDYTLFCNLLIERKTMPAAGFVGVTGTRGKTTVTTWIAHFAQPAVVGGNMPTAGLLKIFPRVKRNKNLVLELSSYQLEYADTQTLWPHVAVITNISPDHLNRYGDMKTYMTIKAKIFAGQTKNDFLILNACDSWTPFFLKQKPKGAVYYFSSSPLVKKQNGVCVRGNSVWFFENGHGEKICAVPAGFSRHQKENLCAAMLAARLYGVPWGKIIARIPTLPSVPFRQEVIFDNGKLLIVNDSASTSPEGTIAAIERFSRQRQPFFLLCGGTDKQLDFAPLARVIKKNLLPDRVLFLEGSATVKLMHVLRRARYFSKKAPRVYTSLDEMMRSLQSVRNGSIVFSPGAASFEKFQNEFDRGKRFTRLARRYLAIQKRK